jgi:hypothetical protein
LNSFLKDCNNCRFLSVQLNTCVRFWAHGGSLWGHPSLEEMAHFIAVAASPLMLGVVTPTLDGDEAKERIPIDVAKFSDSISPWDGNLITWFEWKKKLLTKCWQNPEFEKVLLDSEEAAKDPWRSAILFGILLEKTEGGQAHTLIESNPSNIQSGYKAFKVLQQHMEGAEMRKCLEQQAKRQLNNISEVPRRYEQIFPIVQQNPYIAGLAASPTQSAPRTDSIEC